jgi:predicted O-methyltransferase YrrM
MRFDILNSLIRKYNFTRYLEIGTQFGDCFEKIELPRNNKYCIDLKKAFSDLDEEISSDSFFEKNKSVYDLIFIDGDHSYEQSLKDIKNALNCLSPNGLIVCHDCYPKTIAETIRGASEGWLGEVYKSILYLRVKNPELTIYTVNSDCGVSVIKKAPSKTAEIPNAFQFDWFTANARTLLNLIEVNEFERLMSASE